MGIMSKIFDIGEFIDTETIATVLNGLVARVKKRRKELGLTQRKLAERSGVSYASLRRFEKTGEIALASLLKIGQALNSLGDFNMLFKKSKIKNLKDYRGD